MSIVTGIIFGLVFVGVLVYAKWTRTSHTSDVTNSPSDSINTYEVDTDPGDDNRYI